LDFIPVFDTIKLQLNEGEAFTMNDYCTKKINQKCRSFYSSIKEPGFYTCPHGFHSYATKYSLENNQVYTSLYIKKLAKTKLKKKGYVKNVFNEEEITRLIGLFEQQEKTMSLVKMESENEIELIGSMFHEIRKLSRNINEAGAAIQKVIIHDDDKFVENLIDDIVQLISMIMIRVNSYELIKNPGAITSAMQPNIQVYKKFDKNRYFFKQPCKNKGIEIDFINNCYFSIDGYEIFDILPYILLDNAVKYCPNNNNITVYFDDQQKIISIKNYGPIIEDDEIVHLGKRGYRGKNAKEYSGSGLGLNFARQICELHKIKIKFRTDGNKIIIMKKEYKQFIVELFLDEF
jgi:signal transduction histidine kinase